MEFVEETDGQPVWLSLDAMRVGQVFRNLFDNVLAVCKTPVRVTLRCERRSRDGEDFVWISVRDNGPGLTAEVRKRLFEPFFTTKSRGTGLGLPICKRILEAHGGDLQVGLATDGAEFIVRLPLAETASEKAVAS